MQKLTWFDRFTVIDENRKIVYSLVPFKAQVSGSTFWDVEGLPGTPSYVTFADAVIATGVTDAPLGVSQ